MSGRIDRAPDRGRAGFEAGDLPCDAPPASPTASAFTGPAQ